MLNDTRHTEKLGGIWGYFRTISTVLYQPQMSCVHLMLQNRS